MQAARATLFRELHHRPEMLLLPNVWDVGSAVLLSQVDALRGAQRLTYPDLAAALARGVET